VERAKPERGIEVDDALGLQMISIRLPKKMIEDLKFIAKLNGTGYQPLIRNLCDRFVEHEIKAMIREAQARREQEAKLQSELEKEDSPKKAA
ncbi:MAG: hypothetical protein WCC58_01610, partial [Burkholderiales bacterium]